MEVAIVGVERVERVEGSPAAAADIAMTPEWAPETTAAGLLREEGERPESTRETPESQGLLAA